MAFDIPTSSGSYLAYFDDILVYTKKDDSAAICHQVKADEKLQFITSRNQTLAFNNVALKSNIKIYDLSGVLMFDFVLSKTEVPTKLSNGIYVVKVTNKWVVYSQKIIL
ncbi:T9SS type A sorting domain-containing protein [Aquipluma nitroreducens]